jgi:hypothetical protein
MVPVPNSASRVGAVFNFKGGKKNFKNKIPWVKISRICAGTGFGFVYW